MVSVLRNSLSDLSLNTRFLRRGSTLISPDVSQSDDDDNATVTMRLSSSRASPMLHHQSDEDIRLLAISAQITEISYSISDIQTRMFEMQELRHQAASGDSSSSLASSSTTSTIDQALISLNEKLEEASQSIEELDRSVEAVGLTSRTPTQSTTAKDEEMNVVLRKRERVLEEWDAVQKECEELRKELADDKWLVVFRTVTEQADNMMSSLEKILTQCQEFMWQVQRRNVAEPFIERVGKLEESIPVDYERYLALASNLEAKKTYYVPSVGKILAILDRGIRDHTKNGECLRRHAESRARWKGLKDRIGRVETQMDGVRRTLSQEHNDMTPSEPSSQVSNQSVSSSKGSFETPAVYRQTAKDRSSSTISFSRSMSPFRKLAQRVSSVSIGRPTPPPSNAKVAPSSDPAPLKRLRPSMLLGRMGTPDRSKHSHSSSVVSPAPSNADSSPSRASVDTPTKPKRMWNSSTRISPTTDEPSGTIKAKARRPSTSSSGSLFQQTYNPPPVPPLPPRSASRSSTGSSRPWSPIATTSTISTSSSRASARAPPSRSVSRATDYSMPTTPRSRPKTPSHIPSPSLRNPNSRPPSELDNTDTIRTFSPSASGRRSVSAYSDRSKTPSRIPTPRGSGSYLNVPGSSRPGSSLSRVSGTQTPESTIRARALQLPFYRGSQTQQRPSLSRGPPSAFRGLTPSYDRGLTPSTELLALSPRYVPNLKDPLDVEVAKTVNGVAHGFLIERVDPQLKVAPQEGQELKAQYAISNSLGRKVINCRLVTIKRPSVKSSSTGDASTTKVMCRVGGGWLDLHMYLLNHQAGM